MNGWVWVPVEPTPEMEEAMYGAYDAVDRGIMEDGLMRAAYRAMLAAGPPPAADAVSDAMVEAACLAFLGPDGRTPRQVPHPKMIAQLAPAMRAAIAAALAARGA